MFTIASLSLRNPIQDLTRNESQDLSELVITHISGRRFYNLNCKQQLSQIQQLFDVMEICHAGTAKLRSNDAKRQ